MIEWSDFAKRRKLDLNMFGSVTYEEYSEWCLSRSVTPASQESFDNANPAMPVVSEKKIVSAELPQNEDSLSAKELRKMRKSDLVDYCARNSIQVKGSETKQQLVKLILNKRQV